MKATITFTTSFPIEIKKGAQYFMASCPILDIWAHGKTKHLAIKHLKETLHLFLVYCYEHGTLEKVLKGCGFTALRTPFLRNPSPSSHEVNVSLPFIIDRPSANLDHSRVEVAADARRSS